MTQLLRLYRGQGLPTGEQPPCLHYWTRCPQLGVGFVFKDRNLVGIASGAHTNATLRAPTEVEIDAFKTLLQTMDLPWPADDV